MQGGTKQITVKAYQCGYCTQIERLSNRKGAFKKVQFPTLSFLITHPREGRILFDLGYSRHAHTYCKTFPFQVYNWITPICFDPHQDDLSAQLRRDNIDPATIKTIFLSHFHADHLGDIDDFPNAKIVCSKAGYKSIQGASSFRALKKAFLPQLFRAKHLSRVRYLEDMPQHSISLKPFTKGIYCFQTPQLIAVALPGHARGQYGLYIPSKNMFLISDAAWSMQAIQHKQLPSVVTRLIKDNWASYRATFDALHQLACQTSIRVLPTHDIKSMEVVNGVG